MRGPLRNRSHSAVFLCYHSIADDGPPFLSLSPELFERQLHLLRRLGFRSGGQADLEELRSGRRPSTRRVFLTFDDGYVDNHAAALPLLQRYGFKAMVFVVPPFVDGGAPLIWPELEEQAHAHPAVMRSMTWRMVEEMHEAGTEFGSHTLSHPRLPGLDEEELRQELLDSRARIKDRLGRCDTLAYPFGDWSPRVQRAAADAGYSFAFTLPIGAQRVATALSIPRVPVDHRDAMPRFLGKLSAPGRSLLLSPLKDGLRIARDRGTSVLLPRRGNRP